MDNKIAKALIIGFVFSLIVGFITAHKNVYRSNGHSYERERVIIEKKPGNTYVTEYEFRFELILISFFGGFGLGYLFGDKLEERCNNIYKQYKTRKRSEIKKNLTENTMKQKTPLAPEENENIDFLIWQELRMLNMGITNMEAKLDETNKRISDVERRMLTVYDFENGVSKICDKLSTINLQLK